jgi:hypothetical protein
MTGRWGSGSAREAGQTNPRPAGPDDGAPEDVAADVGVSSALAKEVQPVSASSAAAAAAARSRLTAG